MKKHILLLVIGCLLIQCTPQETPNILDTFTDSRDGKVYKTVTIAAQTWMAENLAYLPSVVGLGTESYTTPNFYVYDYEGSNVSAAKATDNYNTYGVLYNWPAALTACPEGWHLPTDIEWTTLTNYLGGEAVAGGKLKETGFSHWKEPNIGATNTSNFTAIPGGCRTTNFFDLSYGGYYWSSSVNYTHGAWYVCLSNSSMNISLANGTTDVGYSVRCVKDNLNTQPIVVTGPVNNISLTTAKCIGFVTSAGGNFVTARGVCWSTSENPTIANLKSMDGTGLGAYISNITDLTPNTTYYVRAYATNSLGTTYGEQKSLTTYNTLTDSRDGNVYKTVTIGEQTWMAENLAYLPSVVGPGTESYTTPYFYVYDYEGSNVSAAKATDNYNTYGVLYNWHAALTACPEGWHLPSDAEWTTLAEYLGGRSIAGGKLKETGFSHWKEPNTGANNDSGFTALPGGERNSYSDTFRYIRLTSTWWTSTESGTHHAKYRYLGFSSSYVDYFMSMEKDYGFSVRCVKD